MSRFRRQKRSTRIMPGTAICCDCGMNTMPSDKSKPGTHEQFIVNDNVWIAAGMVPGKIDPKNHELVGGGFLCVGCIENRLGRRLTVGDFSIHAREDAEKNEMIESAEREAGEFLRTGGTMS